MYFCTIWVASNWEFSFVGVLIQYCIGFEATVATWNRTSFGKVQLFLYTMDAFLYILESLLKCHVFWYILMCYHVFPIFDILWSHFAEFFSYDWSFHFISRIEAFWYILRISICFGTLWSLRAFCWSDLLYLAHWRIIFLI